MTIWYTNQPCRPRARAALDGQKHPLVPAGHRIVELEESHEWIRSTEEMPEPYPRAWYLREWLSLQVIIPLPAPAPTTLVDEAVLVVWHALLEALRGG
jgi:hypothetical protein